MADHHYEDEELELLKRWWQENRNFVVAGLVIGVGIVVGWRSWQSWQAHQSEQAAAIYAKLEEAVEAKDALTYTALGSALEKDYARTPYAVHGALALAKAAVDDGKLDAARTELEWALANGRDVELAELVRIRLARVQLAQGGAQAALTTLGSGPFGAFEGMAQAVRGDALLALGRKDEARTAYEAASTASADNRGDRALIELKLQDLGPAPAPAATPAPASTPASAAQGGGGR